MVLWIVFLFLYDNKDAGKKKLLIYRARELLAKQDMEFKLNEIDKLFKKRGLPFKAIRHSFYQVAITADGKASSKSKTNTNESKLGTRELRGLKQEQLDQIESYLKRKNLTYTRNANYITVDLSKSEKKDINALKNWIHGTLGVHFKEVGNDLNIFSSAEETLNEGYYSSIMSQIQDIDPKVRTQIQNRWNMFTEFLRKETGLSGKVVEEICGLLQDKEFDFTRLEYSDKRKITLKNGN